MEAELKERMQNIEAIAEHGLQFLTWYPSPTRADNQRVEFVESELEDVTEDEGQLMRLRTRERTKLRLPSSLPKVPPEYFTVEG